MCEEVLWPRIVVCRACVCCVVLWLCVVIMCRKQMKIMKFYMLMLAVCGLFWGSHVEPRLPSALVVVVMKFIM